jgi:hypothetical protein
VSGRRSLALFEENPMKRLAYIGVDGVRYRMLVPIKKVYLRRAEGPSYQCRDWTFDNILDAHTQLCSNTRTAPKDGTYDKHDFTVIWADGHEYEGRYDLEGTEISPSLTAEIRNLMTWLRDDPEFRGTRYHESARIFLETYDVDQLVVAPDDWEVVVDYREEGSRDRDFRELQAAAYDLLVHESS